MNTSADLTPNRVTWGAVALFYALACGLAWLIQIPIWLGDGLASPMFYPVTGVMMLTPTIAALIVTLAVVRPAHKARYLGLAPFKPVKRSVLTMLAWPFVWLAVTAGALALSASLGWARLDFSPSVPGEPPGSLLVMSLVWLPSSVVSSSIAALGEEIGWRGFLTTALAPLGFWKSALVIGPLWGLWHAPIILLGYNYARTDALGLLFMCVFCVLVGIVLQAARHWCRNVWVAAVGHGALNATAMAALPAMKEYDPTLGTSLGVAGWIVLALLVGLLAAAGLTGRLRRPLVPAPAPRLAPEPQH